MWYVHVDGDTPFLPMPYVLAVEWKARLEAKYRGTGIRVCIARKA